MNNIPEVKVGIVAVSRDCFPESLSVNRREALVKAYTDKYGAADIYECPICIVESEIHMVQALEDIKKAGRQVLDYICKLQKEYGFTIVMVTHNLNIAEMANTVIKMNSGKISEIYTNEAQKTAYEIGW